MTNDQIIENILRREGSAFTDDPADRGGATKFGITQKAWDSDAWRTGRGTLPVFDVKLITEADARDFYRAVYVKPLAWIEAEHLRELVIDCAVNHGTDRAVKWLQDAVGVKADGVIGPKTRAAVNLTEFDNLYVFAMRTEITYNELLRTRLRFYAQIATDQVNDPDAKFLCGWINRACEFIRP